MDQKIPQSEKFKQAARELEADEDEARWDEKLGKIVKQKPEKRDATGGRDSNPHPSD